jgi:hypothetical protein
MRCQLVDSRFGCIFTDDMPHSFFCYVVTPSLSAPVHSAKELSGSDVRGIHPIVEDLLNPRWHWNRSRMTAFTLQVDNCPVLLSLLDMPYFKVNGFMPPDSAG